VWSRRWSSEFLHLPSYRKAENDIATPEHRMLRNSKRPLFGLAAAGLFVLSACVDHPLETPSRPQPVGVQPLGLIEVTISGIGTPGMSASAAVPARSGPAAGGASFNLSPVPGDADGSIQLNLLSTGSFTEGARGSGGVRYMYASFRVRNASHDGAAYDTPRQNLTFLAVATPRTLGGSAIAGLRRFDGTPANPAIASQILPTGLVNRDVSGQIRSMGADVLQLFTEAEVSAVQAPSEVTVLPYGFVVRNAASGGRILSANPAPEQYEGVVTFAFHVPLQASSAEDPFTVTAMFLAQDDGQTRITQSLEEQTPQGTTAFLARAQQIGATMKTVLPGTGSYRGEAASTRTLCSVRTAGTSGSPTAYLVNRQVTSITVTDPFPGWPLWSTGQMARALPSQVLDGSGTTLTDVPLQWSFTTPGVLALWQSGIRMLPRRDRASISATAHACGVSSTATAARTSGFSPLAARNNHSLAIRGDGTVAAWGANDAGQTNVPAGLSDVVQVAAGGSHSLALRSDGTVAAWGANNAGQTNVPAGLSDVVQISGSILHSLALRSDGTVVAWGDINYAYVPAGLSGVVQISASNHSLALRSDGTVVAWGRDWNGQTNVPAGLSDVVQVAAGGSHSLALRSNGTVVAWGANNFGQTNVPVGLSSVVQVAASGVHSLALRSDGTVVAWGRDWEGQTHVPADLSGVVQIATGDFHSLALRSDGTVVVWGWDVDGVNRTPVGLVATVP
jgi:hypothetical protein